MSRKVKQLFIIKGVRFSADVTEITKAYDKIFSIACPEVTGYVVTTPFSMINDDEEFREDASVLYYSFYTSNPSVVIAHELFHIYFEKYTQRNIPNYDEAKEYFTVIMNDIFQIEVSGGYPKHQEIRKKIFDVWEKTRSLEECIALLG